MSAEDRAKYANLVREILVVLGKVIFGIGATLGSIFFFIIFALLFCTLAGTFTGSELAELGFFWIKMAAIEAGCIFLMALGIGMMVWPEKK